MKFPNIPRLTIVVPHTGHAETFESTLVSVLQNRPTSCEIVVSHDGTYDDPFELGDEVRFVDAVSRDPLVQIAAAAAFARGRFVHVLTDGHVATDGWADAALDQFEHHDASVVAPIVRDRLDGEISHAGWRSGRSAACELVGTGERELPPRAAASVDGAFLSSGFWRRDLLRQLAGSYRGQDLLEASLAVGLQSRRAGWKCVVAPTSTVVCDLSQPGADVGDYLRRLATNQRRLQAIVDQFEGGGWSKSAPRFVRTLFAGYGLGTALSRATAPLVRTAVTRCLATVELAGPLDRVESLRMPSLSPMLRRAA